MNKRITIALVNRTAKNGNIEEVKSLMENLAKKALHHYESTGSTMSDYFLSLEDKFDILYKVLSCESNMWILTPYGCIETLMNIVC